VVSITRSALPIEMPPLALPRLVLTTWSTGGEVAVDQRVVVVGEEQDRRRRRLAGRGC
jgi:hypothetical protein